MGLVAGMLFGAGVVVADDAVDEEVLVDEAGDETVVDVEVDVDVDVAFGGGTCVMAVVVAGTLHAGTAAGCVAGAAGAGAAAALPKVKDWLVSHGLHLA